MKSRMKRWIRQLVWWAEEGVEDDILVDEGRHTNKGSIFYNSEYREFRIYKADNGHVVEVYHYIKNRDANNTLHIIRSDQDLGNEISKILMVAELKA